MGYNAHMIYIASKTIHAHRWRALREAGEDIHSTWIDEAGPGESKDLCDLWKRCIEEASYSTALVAYREPGEVFKGGFIEIGAALAHSVPCFIVGFEDTFTFLHHPSVRVCKTIEEAFELARRM
jgi:hypothetical protein